MQREVDKNVSKRKVYLLVLTNVFFEEVVNYQNDNSNDICKKKLNLYKRKLNFARTFCIDLLLERTDITNPLRVSVEAKRIPQDKSIKALYFKKHKFK